MIGMDIALSCRFLLVWLRLVPLVVSRWRRLWVVFRLRLVSVIMYRALVVIWLRMWVSDFAVSWFCCLTMVGMFLTDPIRWKGVQSPLNFAFWMVREFLGFLLVLFLVKGSPYVWNLRICGIAEL